MLYIIITATIIDFPIRGSSFKAVQLLCNASCSMHRNKTILVKRVCKNVSNKSQEPYFNYRKIN